MVGTLCVEPYHTNDWNNGAKATQDLFRKHEDFVEGAASSSIHTAQGLKSGCIKCLGAIAKYSHLKG